MSLIRDINLQFSIESLDRNGYKITFAADFQDKKPEFFFMPEEFSVLCKFKSKIDKYKHNWEISKRFINPYELIFTNSKLHLIENVAKKNPMDSNRFKLIQMDSNGFKQS